DTYVRHACKASTWKIYDLDFRVYLDPVFGRTSLPEITREAIIQKLIHPLLTGEGAIEDRAVVPRGERRRRRASRGTVKNVLAALRGCLNHAVENGKLAANPAVRFGRLLRDKDDVEGQRKADFLTAEELSKLLATCLDRYPHFFAFVLTLARTGLRL